MTVSRLDVDPQFEEGDKVKFTSEGLRDDKVHEVSGVAWKPYWGLYIYEVGCNWYFANSLKKV